VSSTTQDAEALDTRRVRRGRTGRRVFLVAISAFLLLGLLDVLGVKTRTVTDGHATLTYASVSRRGLPAPWRLRITVPSSTRTVRVRMDASYVDALDITRVQPEPSSETATSGVVEWEFDRPPPTFTVSLQADVGAHITPGRRSTTTGVLVDGRPTALLSYRTWMLP
jgi:hypothetical protein